MAKTNPQLKAEVRDQLGRKVKNLRKNGILPATVYGHKFTPISIQTSLKEIDKLFEEVGESISGSLEHIDCYKVNLKEKITATVPIELIGESPAVKAGNIMVGVSSEVEVEALPTDLPDKFEVDLSKLVSLEQTITIADLVYDKEKVEIKTPLEQVIVKLEEPKEEEEPVVEEVAPGEVPATEQKAPEEGGETPAAEGEKQEENK